MPARQGYCPKCDYDLGGIRASWRESCPLRGVCPECGFQFNWGHLITPMSTTPHPARRTLRSPAWVGCLVFLLVGALFLVGWWLLDSST